VLQLFRDDGFPVHHNPGTARPRQTDIFAIGYDMLLLIEVKDRRRLIFKQRVGCDHRLRRPVWMSASMTGEQLGADGALRAPCVSRRVRVAGRGADDDASPACPWSTYVPRCKTIRPARQRRTTARIPELTTGLPVITAAPGGHVASSSMGRRTETRSQRHR
jgi:hypothetical protein